MIVNTKFIEWIVIKQNILQYWENQVWPFIVFYLSSEKVIVPIKEQIVFVWEDCVNWGNLLDKKIKWFDL